MNWAMQKCPNSCTKICSNDFHYFYQKNERSYKPESACVDADHDDDDQQKLGTVINDDDDDDDDDATESSDYSTHKMIT